MRCQAARRRGARGAAWAWALLALAGCVGAPPAPPPAGSPAAPPGLMDLLDRPAERALLDGLRAYEDGRYAAAEPALNQALALDLRHPRDRATAHKLLAFMQCTSQRMRACEAAFRAARDSDPAFALTRAEAGHPLWGPVYRRVLP